MTAPVAVILAAGKSTRMKSETPKVLHPVCGRMLIDYVLDAARDAGVEKIVVIVGHKADMVQKALQHHPDVVFAEQKEQNGTGHAVMMAEPHLKDHHGSVLILAGDTPLLQGSSLKALLDDQASEGAACVIGTADTADNQGLGRVVRDSKGKFECIVEEKDANDQQKQITEINTGCYAFQTQLLLESLNQLKPNNAQAEYYLTDCPRILMDAGHAVAASCSLTIEEAIGVNNRLQLAQVHRHIQDGIQHAMMVSGVTIIDPAQTTIDAAVSIGNDSVIQPGCVIEGDVTIGSHCVIGPNLHLRGPLVIGDNESVS
ncbi:MAG: NTP transferase domain-containing protein [Fuerstiella sp.]